MFIQSFRFRFLGVFLSCFLALVLGCEKNSEEELQPATEPLSRKPAPKTPDSNDAGTSIVDAGMQLSLEQ